jgi:hypothetical protein
LGFPHPDYLLPWLTCRQLGDWERYFAAEPGGDPFTELLHGIRCAVMANTFANSEGEAFQPEAFMPSWDPLENQPTPDEVRDAVRAAKGIAANQRGS